jgi:hypothetical protein
MNSALEFHDSTVASVEVVDGTLTIRFMVAYIHQSAGEPGISPGEAYIQPAALVFSGIDKATAPFPKGTLSDGVIRVDGRELRILQLPFALQGAVEAEFRFASGAVLTVSATSVRCTTFGTPFWVEFFAGSSQHCLPAAVAARP